MVVWFDLQIVTGAERVHESLIAQLVLNHSAFAVSQGNEVDTLS